MGGDGQVTLGNTVMKANARKVRRLYKDQVIAGFWPALAAYAGITLVSAAFSLDRMVSLTDWHARHFGLSDGIGNEKWLELPSVKVARFIFNLTKMKVHR